MATPGTLPVSAALTLPIPAERSSTSPVVWVMAPTTEAFFCWPKPTTITSESWVLSLSVTLNVRRLPTFNSSVFIPTYETTMVEDSDGTLREKLPSKSVIVPIEVFPFTTTEAPISASPFASITVPLTAMPPCAHAVAQNRSINDNADQRHCLLAHGRAVPTKFINCFI